MLNVLWTLSFSPVGLQRCELKPASSSLSACHRHAELIRLDLSKRAANSGTHQLACSRRRRSVCLCSSPEEGHVERAAAEMPSDGDCLAEMPSDGDGVVEPGHGVVAPATAEMPSDVVCVKESGHGAVGAATEEMPSDGGCVTEPGHGAGLAARADIPSDSDGVEEASDSDGVEEARAALAMALCEAGLLEEDSTLIASKAPTTVVSLVSAALELDELATWTSEQPLQHQDFQQKIFEFTMANPGRQFAAVIESIGVEPRYISRVCHVLASQNLADVLEKIRFLEELFPDDKDDGIIIRTRRMMREMSVSADEGLQKTLSFFEKMEARRGGISTLNIPREAISHLIGEFPQVLVRNLDSDLKALVDYFENIGVPKEYIASVFICYPSILIYGSIEELQSRLRTLKKQASVRPRDFGRMVVKYPWILSRSVEDNVQAVVVFLTTAKVPPGKIGRSITKCPNLLGCSTRTLQVMVQQMILTGVKSKRIGYVIAHSPQLLLKTPRAFLEIAKFLESLGLDENDIPNVLVESPSLFASTVPFLRKKITFLQQLGIRNQRLKFVLQKYPEVLMMSVEDSLKPRLNFLQSMGLSNEDIAFMICGFPPLLGYSIEGVLRPKFEVLQNVLCHPVEEVVSYPRYFSYCLRKKILPRFRVLKRLSIEWDLKSMLSKSDDEFAQDHLGFGRMLVPPV